MDEGDRGQAAAEAHLHDSLARHEGRRSAHAGPACTHCIDCGGPIPDGRRRLVIDCRRCLTCQEAYERGQ